MQTLCSIIIMGFIIMACTPTVKVEALSEPITINLNIKIDHEIHVKVDKELDNIFSQNSGLF